MMAIATYTFLLTALWQGAAITAIAFVAIKVFMVSDASARVTVWSLAFFSAVILPFAVFLPGPNFAFVPVGNAGEREFVTLAAPTAFGSGYVSPAATESTNHQAELLLPVMFLIWSIGALGRVSKIARDVAAVETLRRESTRVTGASFGLPDSADIRVHANLNSPLAVGLFRPSIMLPAGMVDERGAGLHGALAHEHAHLERGDLIANCAETVLLCLFWWNPFLYFIRNAIAENREMACDDRAVLHTENAYAYASTLVSFAERAMVSRMASPVSAASLGVAGGRSRLARRIARLADQDYSPQTRMTTRRFWLAGAAIMMATACAATAAPRVNLNPNDASPAYLQAAPASESERLGRELVEAVIDDDIDRAEILLAQGADINAVLEGDGTPLIAAVNNNCFGFATWLIANGADIDRYARYDETALISAVRKRDRQMVRLLVNAGADVNLSAKTETGEVRSPLGEARKRGLDEITQLLIDRGAVQ